LASSGKNEMLFAFESQKLGRRRNVEAVPVGIISRTHLCTMRLRTADAGHDQIFLMNESVLCEVRFQFVTLYINGTALSS
jgi:hypothetical protein